ncbi:MAG: hypothetical protein HFI71_15335 [Lachnospiraceae bacterium]|jgi:choline-glycine betaine transporter|nr:hypothetical protein [Lachnospiraceae bacterium]
MITYLLNSTNSQIQNLETGIIVLAVLFLIVFAAMICFIIILEKQIEKLTTKKKLTEIEDNSQEQKGEGD